MTSPLHRKRRTTPRWSTPALTPVKLACLAVLLAGPCASAQGLPPAERIVVPDVPVALQAGRPVASTPAERFADRLVQSEIPGPEALFRLDSERDLEERIRQIALDVGATTYAVPFPELPRLTDQEYQGRSFPRQGIAVEPNFVNHRRLYFYDLNHERYGWDYGFFQPVISAARFYKDVVFLPNRFGARPHCRWESSAGYCYPGDPVPYLMYPPELTAAGAAAQVGSVLGLAFIFP